MMFRSPMGFVEGSTVASGSIEAVRVKQMAQGTIKKLTDKGFGFIDTGTGRDLFFHSKALVSGSYDDLYEGQQVEFTEGRGPKGPNAENVRPV